MTSFTNTTNLVTRARARARRVRAAVRKTLKSKRPLCQNCEQPMTNNVCAKCDLKEPISRRASAISEVLSISPPPKRPALKDVTTPRPLALTLRRPVKNKALQREKDHEPTLGFVFSGKTIALLFVLFLLFRHLNFLRILRFRGPLEH